MKEVNLKSIIESYESLNEDMFNKYLTYFEWELKNTEKNDLKILVNILSQYVDDINIFWGFFLWFIIPQIWKEFDLLKFWENFNINIELKSTNVWEDRIKDQLIKNKYFLGYLDKISYYFTFVSSVKKIFTLDDTGNLVEVSIKELVDKLNTQENKYIDNIENLFNPSDFLVSPFNSTEKFIENKYFLTKQQDDFKKEIIDEIENKNNLLLWLTWDAWTWKTLLTYDIAKVFLWRVLIIHCWYLNSWHMKLRESCWWNIIPIKDIKNEIYQTDLDVYDLIIIDETQRILIGQLDLIIKNAKEKEISCIFSYDKKQFLWNWEENKIIEKEAENNFKLFNLTNRIRTNKEISNFISWFLKKDREITSYYNKSNIDFLYFKTETEARKYIQLLIEKDWKKIDYTPSNRHLDYESICPMYNIKLWSKNAHTVIWQEFDKVIVVVDNSFFYGHDNQLSTRYPNPYYLPVKMLFQIMTRVRKKLKIVIIDNPEILNRCLELLKK